MPEDPDRTSRLTIPIFPLSTVVLFPGGDCPLHIFEPRYRQMIRDAAAGDGLIGMVTVRPEHTGDMAGDPAVFPIGSMGRIQHNEELEDGRLNIVLRGTTRFRIQDEPARPDAQLYRTAVVVPLEEEATAPEELAQHRERVSRAFRRLLEILAPDRADQIGPHKLADVDDATFLGVLVQVLNLPPVERQSLLETNGVGPRLAALESILQFQLIRLGLGSSDGPDRVH